MKVWILHHLDYGDISVWSEDTNPLNIPLVKDELEYVDEARGEEGEDFRNSIANAIRRGHGSATIEERFEIELTEVNTL